MNKLLRRIFCVLSCTAVFAFAACTDIETGSESAEDGKAYINVSLDTATARMICPTDITDDEITRAELFSMKADKEATLLVKSWNSSSKKMQFKL